MLRRSSVDHTNTEYIDGLRGIAVLAVVLHHTLLDVTGPPFAPYVFSAGARGVDLFFVISGFCLSHKVSSATDAARTEPVGEFLLSRLFRIAPTYLVALGLFAVLSFTPFGLPTAVGNADMSVHSRLDELLRESVFILPHHPAFNSSFWTLGIEMRWYLFFPLLIALFKLSKTAFACVGAGLYALYATPWSIVDAGTLPSFMLGTIAASFATKRHVAIERVSFLAATVALTVALVQQSRTPEVDHGNALWHVACFLVVVAGGYGVFRRALSFAPLRSIGIASYSIYLVHEPLIACAISHGVPRALAALGSVGMGIGFWFSVERVLSGPRRAKCRASVLASAAP